MYRFLFCLLFGWSTATVARGVDLPVPTRVEFAESDLRQLLPPDGELVQQGEISKEYTGLSFGRRVRARGKNVFVSEEKIGAQGIIFRDGYIEVNVGAHVEKEEKIAFLKPTFAVDAAMTAKITLGDNGKAAVEVVHLDLHPDNEGAAAIFPFAKSRLEEAARGEANKLADKVSNAIAAALPKGVTVQIDIQPGKLIAVRTSPTPVQPPRPKGRIHACDEVDRCGRDVLRVKGASGMTEVRKGQSVEVRVSLDKDGFFHWQCGDSWERTRPSDSRTTIVMVTREPNGRRIDWKCFREE